MPGPVRIDGPTSEAAGERHFSRRKVLVLAALAAVAGAGYLWGMRDWRLAHDRHLVRGELARLESAIRGAHGLEDWLYVESGTEPSEEEARHPEHVALLGTLERLAHIDGFAFKDVQIAIDRDRARVMCGVAGRARAGYPPPPPWLSMAFERRRGRWFLARIGIHEPVPRVSVSPRG